MMSRARSAPGTTLRHSASSPDVRQTPKKDLTMTVREPIQQIQSRHESAHVKAHSSDEYSCNICFDVAANPVLTACGHLYCWACLYQWLILPTQAIAPMCPVCKSGCDVASLTPIYGRGNQHENISSSMELQHLADVTTENKITHKPRNIVDQWLLSHLHPPSLPILRRKTPARPVAHPRPVRRVRKLNSIVTHAPQTGIFGNTHPIVLFSAGITTLCGMQILQNGGFSTNDPLESGLNTSRIMWLLAFLIIAGVWFH